MESWIRDAIRACIPIKCKIAIQNIVFCTLPNTFPFTSTARVDILSLFDKYITLHSCHVPV